MMFLQKECPLWWIKGVTMVDQGGHNGGPRGPTNRRGWGGGGGGGYRYLYLLKIFLQKCERFAR